MARQIVTQWFCDKCGQHIEIEDLTRRSFTAQGSDRQADFCPACAREFDESVGEWLKVVPASAPIRKRVRSAGRSRAELGAIRVWARENGFEVSDRGRIPARVVKAYENAVVVGQPAK